MPPKVTTEEVTQKLEEKSGAYVVDVLTAKSYETHHIPGTSSVPFNESFVKEFEERIGAPKDAEIITYCASNGCKTSAVAAIVLQEAGYTNVSHYADGLAGWKEAGYKIEGEETESGS